MGKMKDIYTFLQSIGINTSKESIPDDFTLKVHIELQKKNITEKEKEEEIKQAFKDMKDLSDIIPDDKKALEAWKKGFVAADFLKEEYRDLPLEWVWNLLDIDNKSIYTRDMPHY